MKRVQEYGVKADIHFKKPFMYTGSWMENVHSIEDLMAEIEDSPSSEASLKLFNVLVPYPDPLPGFDGDEQSIQKFFGEVWEKNQARSNPDKRKLAEDGIKHLLGYETEVNPDIEVVKEPIGGDGGGGGADPEEVQNLKGLLEASEMRLEDSEKENERLKAELEVQAADPGPSQELAKSYVANAKLEKTIKALTNEITETSQRLEEAEGRIMLANKDCEKRLTEMRARVRKVDPTSQFSNAKVKAEKRRIAKERGEDIPEDKDEEVEDVKRGTGGKSKSRERLRTSKERITEKPSKPMTNDQRKAYMGTMTNAI